MKNRGNIITLVSFLVSAFIIIGSTYYSETANEPETVVVFSNIPTIYEALKVSAETYVAPVEEVVEEEIVVESYYNFTDADVDLLSRCVSAEGKTESFETKKMIASVIMNRVESKLFPNSIEEVIYSPKQFSVTTLKIKGIVMIDYPADDESLKASYEVLMSGSILPKDVMVFYEKGVTNNWVNTRQVFALKDTTVFSYIY